MSRYFAYYPRGGAHTWDHHLVTDNARGQFARVAAGGGGIMERSEVSDVLDSHVHFWDPHGLHYPWLAAEPALNRAFLPADLAAARRSDGGGVLVVEADRAPQEAVAEVDWLTGLA